MIYWACKHIYTMDEILDAATESQSKSKMFSISSLVIALVTLSISGYLIMSIPARIKASEPLQAPPVIIVSALWFFCITGVIVTIFSFVKKEPSSWFKWVGAIINIFLCIFIVGAVIFSKIV